MRFLSMTGLVLVAFAGPIGCSSSDDGGQTGDLGGEHSDDGGSTGADRCKETRAALASLTTTSPLGFSAAQVLTLAGGTREEKLSWRALPNLDYGPEAAEGQLSLTVEGAGGADYVTFAAPSGNGSGPGIEIGNQCPPPRIEVAVHARLTSDGGALAESFDTVLKATSPDAATLAYDFGAHPLAGEFAVVSVRPAGARLLGPVFDATLFASRMTGSLSGVVEVRDANVVGVQGVTIATFPADAACASSPTGGAGLAILPEDSALGLTGAEIVEAVGATTPSEWTWSDGNTSEIRLSATLTGEGCLRDGSVPTATFPIELHAVTSDGKLDGSYRGELQLTRALDAAGIARDGHTFHVDAFLPLGVNEVNKTGFVSVTVPPDQDRLVVVVSLEFGAGRAASLSLALNAQKDADCVKNPPPCTQNGCPGCEGTHVSTILGGSFGTTP